MSTETITYRTTDSGAPTSQVRKIKTVGADYDVTYYYTYDDNGNILTVSDATNITSYVYDSANQLIRENNQAAGKTWTYAYDDAGNITKKQEYAYTTGTLGTAVDTIDYAYGDSTWNDLLTSYDGNTITYDTIGNPLSDGTWTYTWEHGRELTSMTSADKTVTYTYNADGLRVSKTVDGVVHNYVYSGGKLVQETFGDTRLDFSYDAYGNPYTFSYTKGDGKTSVYHYVLNQQGDVIRIVTNKGVTRVTYEYDAWGNIINMTYTRKVLADTNPLCYRGYVYDHDTGLYYLQSRYYNPETGRFLNADAYASTGQGLLGNNMFAYCLNNPIYYIDSSGSLPIEGIANSQFMTYGGHYIDLIRQAEVIGNNADISEGEISINMDQAAATILKLSQDYSMTYICDTIAISACDKYYDTYGEEFLLSDLCVSYEIEEHIVAYYWSTGDFAFPNTIALGFSVINWDFSGTAVYNATRTIDMRERDVAAGGNFMSQSALFGYKAGIRKVYIGTERDPWASMR